MTAPVTPAVRALRLKAAEIIEQRGWCKGSYGELASGPVCLVGALQAANGQDTAGCRIGSLTHEAIKSLLIRGVRDEYDAIQWNDRKRRTQADVLHRLREGL